MGAAGGTRCASGVGLERPVYLLCHVFMEIHMPPWKVLFILLFACVCLALTLAALVVPLALTNEEHRWLWFAGLLVASVGMGTLFTIYLRYEDRHFRVGR
jgi:hypothetical protein